MPGASRRLRMTPQRQVVLDVLRASHDHPTATAVYERARQRYPGIAYATIYNTLNALVGAGLVRQLPMGEAAARYEYRTDEHAHALCRQCGALVDLDAAWPGDAVARAAAERGFSIEAVEVQVHGRCRSCRS
ncbi:MAG TPA: transcriptional repressor [Chloroflexota bacterium]